MDFHIQIKAIRMELSIIYFKGLQVVFPNNDVFLSVRIVFTLTISVDPDEMRIMQHFIRVFTFCHSTC